jgi:hypothetical protein
MIDMRAEYVRSEQCTERARIALGKGVINNDSHQGIYARVMRSMNVSCNTLEREAEKFLPSRARHAQAHTHRYIQVHIENSYLVMLDMHRHTYIDIYRCV